MTPVARASAAHNSCPTSLKLVLHAIKHIALTVKDVSQRQQLQRPAHLILGRISGMQLNDPLAEFHAHARRLLDRHSGKEHILSAQGALVLHVQLRQSVSWDVLVKLQIFMFQQLMPSCIHRATVAREQKRKKHMRRVW